MIKNLSINKLLALVILSVSLFFAGCEKKVEKTDQPTEEVITKQNRPDSLTETKEPVAEEKISIPDLKGTWVGTFDKRTTTLKITEQSDSSFSGKITINYREVINQEVKGTISPTTMKVSMKDQLHSRYQGKYNGTLSKDGNNFSGTFTMDLDGKKFSFNLNKK